MSNPIAIEINPTGTWRQSRYEFCNALEAATDEKLAAQIRAAAWAQLDRFGIKQAPAGNDVDLIKEARNG
jgi:hypothetical protein